MKSQKIKLFGGYSSSRSRSAKAGSAAVATEDGAAKQKKKRTALDRILSIFLALVLIESLYCIAVFSDIPFIKKYRDLWIQTAMSTMNHQWLATAFIPSSIIDEVMANVERSREEQIGVNSDWGGKKNDGTGTKLSGEQAEFYDTFWELDQNSMEAYVQANPSVTANGWDQISINEAGLDDEGTSIYTTMGEQVLAIDAKNQVLLVRVEGSGYRGVLAIAKDPERLSIRPSSDLGYAGECAGDIAENNNGILAMTASGFIDDGGAGNGGTLAGYTMCNGEEHGDHMWWGYKRLELREDNLMYITDAPDAVHPDTTDAVEFTPALIIDGKNIVGEDNDWNGINPRACIGQSDKYEALMLVIEGRRPGTSVGTSVLECSKILERHNCQQAMNLDGGTSAIMWYDGEYVTLCSNAALDSGRYLPNAFVYEKK